MKRTGSQFQCLECGEHFIDTSSFGRHFRRETAQCQTTDEMRAAGMQINAAGFWFIQCPAARTFDIGFAKGAP
jgi:hypothetical protein